MMDRNPARENSRGSTVRDALEERWRQPGCAWPQHRAAWASRSVLVKQPYVLLQPRCGASSDREE